MNQHYQAVITIAIFLIGVPVGWWSCNKVRRFLRAPRMLISHESIPIGDRRDGSPMGLHHVINGVLVREDDVVFLTRQAVVSSNGFWKASVRPWRRIRTPNEVTFVPSGDGHWVLDTKELKKKQTKVKRVSRYKRKWVI